MRWDCSEVFRRAAAAGWSDSELARRVGLHRSIISRLRHGHFQPSIRFYAGIRDAFPDTSPEELIQRVEDVSA